MSTNLEKSIEALDSCVSLNARARMMETLLIYISNVLNHPNDDVYRRIRIGNVNFSKYVAQTNGATVLIELGFDTTRINGEDYLTLSDSDLVNDHFVLAKELIDAKLKEVLTKIKHDEQEMEGLSDSDTDSKSTSSTASNSSTSSSSSASSSSSTKSTKSNNSESMQTESSKKAGGFSFKKMNLFRGSNKTAKKSRLNIYGNESRFAVGGADTVGRRPTMEDEMVIYGHFRGNEDEDYFAVFDGHGGPDVSAYCAAELHKRLAKYLDDEEEYIDRDDWSPEECLSQAFIQINEEVMNDGYQGGTTALVCYAKGNRLWVANAGDSRAVLGHRDGSATRLSVDHKPDLPDEELRIRKLGGHVTTFTLGSLSCSRVNGILAVSRAIGDWYLQPLVCPDPYVSEKVIIDDPQNLFLILACDGLYDVTTDAQAVTQAYDVFSDPESAATKLRDYAYSEVPPIENGGDGWEMGEIGSENPIENGSRMRKSSGKVITL